MNNAVFTDNQCFVSTITLAAIHAFGLDSLQIQPQLLRDMFQQRFQLKKLPQKAFDKLNCGYSLIGTNLYSSSIEGFLSCNCVMANKPLDEDKISFNSLSDVAWGIWQYCNLTGQMEKGKPTQPFSDQVKTYIQQLGRTVGIVKFPQWMSFAQESDAMANQLMQDEATFESYMRRQQNESNQLTQFVTAKQQRLIQQLQGLKTAGLL